MENIFEVPCGTLKISMSEHKMVAIVYDNDPYYGDKIDYPVKIYRGMIENYMGERGRVLHGWINTPCISNSLLVDIKDGNSIFLKKNVHKIYDVNSTCRIF